MMPAPVISAPQVFKKPCRSSISGSLAALESTVTPLRAAGRQHQIFRGPHRGEPQHDLPPRQLCRLAVQGAAGIVDLRPKCPEAGEVQVDGPGT